MFSIRAVRIEIQTSVGEFGNTFRFKDGLNIIKGANTAGKSTVFQSILYALGMEEMLGGRNAPTMQSALRDALEYPKNEFQQVLESKVLLEIENESVITIERAVRGNRSPKLVRVHHGPLITEKRSIKDFSDMWVHDPGAAKNEEHGFHRFLEKFLGWELPQVISSAGEPVKLYIQTVFPAFIVEQKAGWSDFLATIPYFSIRESASKAVEFVLALDVFETERKRQDINNRRDSIVSRWRGGFELLKKIQRDLDISVVGIPAEPEIINTSKSLPITIKKGGASVEFVQYIEELRNQYAELERRPIATVGDNLIKTNEDLLKKQEVLNTRAIEYEVLSQKLSLKKKREESYDQQLANVRQELRHNKDVQKIYDLGGEAQLSISNNKCPTCSQFVEDSLYMQDVHLTPMDITENIRYVEAQEKMIAAYLENEQKSIKLDNLHLGKLNEEISLLREEIRSLRGELVAPEKNPSIVELEQRIRLGKMIDDYAKVLESISETLSTLIDLSEEWRNLLAAEKRLPSGNLSSEDYAKVDMLESLFRSRLNDFGYSSKAQKDISISKEPNRKFLLPIAKSDNFAYNIRFDSSGSDLIRAIWAYYCSLLEVANKYKTNHPRLLIFDEPIQQDVSHRSLNSFFKRLESYNKDQVLVFAAFGESSSDYAAITKGISNFHLIDIVDRTICPVK